MSIDVSDFLARAQAALRQGKLVDAEKLTRSVLETDSANGAAQMLMGMVLVKGNRVEEAVPFLEGAAGSDLPEAPMWLSRAFRRLRRPEEALVAAQQAAKLSPQSPPAQHQLGLCFLDHHRYAEAETCLRKALSLDPRAGIVAHGLGLALQGQGKSGEAIEVFRNLPPAVPVLESLWKALMDENRSGEAIECARTIGTLQPGRVENDLRLAQALLLDGQAAAAESYVRKAAGSGFAAYLLGTILRSLGRIEEARAAFARSIELLPDQGSAYAGIVYGGKVGAGDAALVRTMRELAGAETLDRPEASVLQYALGKASEDLGDCEAAMGHFDAANEFALRVGQPAFDRQLYAERIDGMIATFDRDFMQRYADVGGASDLPIFVVGMIRSGTTLVEQILTSHPEVGSAGEQRFWLARRGMAVARGSSSLDTERLRAFAEEYRRLLQSIAPSKGHVVDKMPDNYLELPLLHLAFPRAKILHLVRNPVDTCLSIYTTINRLAIDWSHDKESIVFVYRQYLRLMDHWRSVLPESVMLDVRYEQLVSEREAVTRQMIGFCGLEWDEACLRPEENRRTVLTPSAWQVRQPVYATSVNRWRRYEGCLGAFGELRDVGAVG